MRTILTILCFAILPISVTAQETLTLDEAIQTALDNNYQLLQAKNSLDLTEIQITSAYADFLPNLSGSFSGNRNIGRQFIPEELTFEDRTAQSLSGNLSTNITLFSGFQNINNLRQSRVNHSQQQMDTQRMRENIIFNTATRYLQVLLNMELLEIAQQNLETSRVQLEQVEAQVEIGSRPVVDLYQQQSTVANNELQVVQAENSVNISKTQLIRMLQIDPLIEYEFVAPDFEDEDLLPRDLNLQELINIALQSRKDVEAQRLEIESSRYNLNIARANRYPSISANASFGSSYSDQYSLADPITGVRESVGFQDQFFDQRITRSVGFNISIPIFNRWNTNVQIEQARVQHRNAQLSLMDIEYEVREEISQAYNDYISLAKELEATERSLIAAERSYETQQQRYEIGATSLIELNQATRDYIEALSNRQQVVYNFIFQEKLLDYYLGRLGEGLHL